MNWRFKGTPTFWKSLYRLPLQQQETARRVFQIFKINPFDPRLHTHKIHHLSAHYGRTIHAVRVEGDLRVIFYLEGNAVITVDIGTHAIYR
ncbi:MAG: hypothetical protein PHV34_06500 [Verrucomicrobiae bacterium]|nr:hypothetical protein [Verrucomicrobiae bacterium]